jgi:hypothetical protein
MNSNVADSYIDNIKFKSWCSLIMILCNLQGEVSGAWKWTLIQDKKYMRGLGPTLTSGKQGKIEIFSQPPQGVQEGVVSSGPVGSGEW